MRAVIAIAALISLFVVPMPAQARQDRGNVDRTAKSGMVCPDILQAANALRLATPAQIAEYRARLAPACRERLLLEAELIVDSDGRFIIQDGQVWVPAGWSGDGWGHSRELNSAGVDARADREKEVREKINGFTDRMINLGNDILEVSGVVGGGVALGGAPVAGVAIGVTGGGDRPRA